MLLGKTVGQLHFAEIAKSKRGRKSEVMMFGGMLASQGYERGDNRALTMLHLTDQNQFRSSLDRFKCSRSTLSKNSTTPRDADAR